MLDNFRKTLLEITYFKVTFKLRLLISNLASIYRLALIPVRLIMEGVLYDLGAGEGPTELPEVTERITVTTHHTKSLSITFQFLSTDTVSRP